MLGNTCAVNKQKKGLEFLDFQTRILVSILNSNLQKLSKYMLSYCFNILENFILLFINLSVYPFIYLFFHSSIYMHYVYINTFEPNVNCIIFLTMNIALQMQRQY